VQIRCNCFYEIFKSASLFGINKRAEDVGEIEGIILMNVTSRDQVLIRSKFAASVSAVYVCDEATELTPLRLAFTFYLSGYCSIRYGFRTAVAEINPT
jgi:hypothetical protein